MKVWLPLCCISTYVLFFFGQSRYVGLTACMGSCNTQQKKIYADFVDFLLFCTNQEINVYEAINANFNCIGFLLKKINKNCEFVKIELYLWHKSWDNSMHSKLIKDVRQKQNRLFLFKMDFLIISSKLILINARSNKT